MVELEVLDLLEEGSREGAQLLGELVALALERGVRLLQLLQLGAARRRARARAARRRLARLPRERDGEPVALLLQRGVGALEGVDPAGELLALGAAPLSLDGVAAAGGAPLVFV